MKSAWEVHRAADRIARPAALLTQPCVIAALLRLQERFEELIASVETASISDLEPLCQELMELVQSVRALLPLPRLRSPAWGR